MLPPSVGNVELAADPNSNGSQFDGSASALIPLPTQTGTIAPMPWSQGPAPPPESLSAGPSISALLHSLRRKLIVSAALGLVLGVLAAAAVWFFLPMNHEVAGYIQLLSEKPNVYTTKHQRRNDDFFIYKQTQAALIRSPYVLNKALNVPGIIELKTLREEEDPLAWLTEELRVNFSEESEVMEISLSGERADEIAKIVNAIIDAYKDDAKTLEEHDAKMKFDKLHSQLRDIEKQYETVQSDLLRMAQTLGTSDLGNANMREKLELDEISTLNREILSMRQKRNDLELELQSLQAQKQIYETMEPTADEIDIAMRADPTYVELETHKRTIELQLQQAESLLRGDDHPRVVQLRKSLADAEQDLQEMRDEMMPTIKERVMRSTTGNQQGIDMMIQLVQTQLESVGSQFDELSKRHRELVDRRKTTGLSTAELESLREEREILVQMRRDLSSQVQIARMEQEAESRVVVLNKAEPPAGSSVVMRLAMVGFAGVLAFCVPGIALAFVESQARRLNTESDVSTGLGIPVLGKLPALGVAGGARSKKAKRLQSILLESIDGIRTTMMLNSTHGHMRSVLVTSPTGGEGKTTVATQLAASLARAGRRTLLIDGDLRKPTAHKLLDQPLDPGLAEVLRGEVEVDDAIRPTRASGMWLMAAGQCDQHSIHALAKDDLEAVFQRLREDFDFIVVDSSPVMAAADALLIGRHVDGAIISVRRDESRVPRIYETHERLKAVGIEVLGAVYNGDRTTVAGRVPVNALPVSSAGQ